MALDNDSVKISKSASLKNIALARAQRNNSGTDYVNNEVIIKLKRPGPGTTVLSSASAIDAMTADNAAISGLKIKYGIKDERPLFHGSNACRKGMASADVNNLSMNALKAAGNPVYVFKTDKDPLEVSRALANDPGIEYAEPNYILKAQKVANDPYYSSKGTWGQPYDDLWGIKKIQCEQAWDISEGEGVVVAVVDTGVDYNHPDLWENIWVNPDIVSDRNGDGKIDLNDCDLNADRVIEQNEIVDNMFGWDFYNGDNDPMDGYGHGTHCAGIVAAAGNNNIGIVGVAPKAKIMVLKGLNDAGSGTVESLSNAIEYAYTNGANVLSNSWGGNVTSRTLVDVFHAAHEAGAVAVAAAGNDNSDLAVQTPANIDTVISVGATDYQDRKAGFSNYGMGMTVTAPGVDILSSFPLGMTTETERVVVETGTPLSTKFPADSFQYSQALPAGGLNGQVVYAGLGKTVDFAKVNVIGKIALVERGEITFYEKAINALNAGASCIIIYNNVDGGFRGTLQSNVAISAVSVLKKDGEAVLSAITAGSPVDASVKNVDLGDYTSWQGTSMACPYAAGLAALIKSVHHGESPDDIKGRILAGSDNVDGLNPDYYGLLGKGRINCYKSLIASRMPVLKITGLQCDILNPQEATPLIITLENSWLDAVDVSATLTTSDPYVTIEKGTSSFGAVPGGAKSDNTQDPFIITVDKGLALGSEINFRLAARDRSGYQETMDLGVFYGFFQNAGSRSGLPMNDRIPLSTLMADCNADGYPDVTYIGYDFFRYYINRQNGSYLNVTGEANIDPGDIPLAVCAFDVNNDGYKDIFISTLVLQPNYEYICENRLFLNNSDGLFSDITNMTGIKNAGPFEDITVFDYNNDGYLDIFGGCEYGKLLLKNNGDKTFKDVSAECGVRWPLSKIGIEGYNQIAAFDYNDDNREDLLVLGSRYVTEGVYAYGAFLFRNNGDGTFTDVDDSAGLNPCFYDSTVLETLNTGVAVGDYNNDGKSDVLLGNYLDFDAMRVRSLLFRNDGGRFTNVTKEAGDPGADVACTWWGTDFFDYDNDGSLDLYMTSCLVTGMGVEKNTLWQNRNGMFSNVTDSVFGKQVMPGGASACIGDYNCDGTQDIYAPGGAYGLGSGVFLRNIFGNRNNWIKIKLEGTQSNRDAYGAKVYVKTGAEKQFREVHYSSVEANPVHFGLGQHTQIDEITIRWPSGIVQKLYGQGVNRTLSVKEPVNTPPTCLSSTTWGSGRVISAKIDFYIDAVYGDSDGLADLAYCDAKIALDPDSSNGVFLRYDRIDNKIYLRSDDGSAWLGGFAPRSANTIENSNVKVNCSLSNFYNDSQGKGRICVRYFIQLKDSAVGPQNIYLQAADMAQTLSGWKLMKSIVVCPALEIVSLTPSSGNYQVNSLYTFTSVVSDAYKTNTGVWMSLNGAFNNTFCAYYSRATNKLWLNNEKSLLVGGFVPGDNKVIDTIFGTLDCKNTRVYDSGDNLVIEWRVSFKGSVAGTKYLSMQATRLQNPGGLVATDRKTQGSINILK